MRRTHPGTAAPSSLAPVGWSCSRPTTQACSFPAQHSRSQEGGLPGSLPLTLSGSEPERWWSSPPTSPSCSLSPSPLGSTLLFQFPSCYLLMLDLVGSQVAHDLSPQVLLLLGGGFPRSDIAPGPAGTFGPRMHKGRTDRLWGYHQPSGSIRAATVGPQTNCFSERPHPASPGAGQLGRAEQ